MGASKSKIAFEVCVICGEIRDQSSPPAVKVNLFDVHNNQSPTFTLEADFKPDENGALQDHFSLDNMSWCSTKVFGKLQRLEFWLIYDVLPSEWFCEKVIIRDRRKGLKGKWDYVFFPVYRWIRPERHYIVHHNETFLPIEDPFPQFREEEINERRLTFVYTQRHKGFPMEIKDVPTDEFFISDTRWDIEDMKMEVIAKNNLTPFYNSTDAWECIEALTELYKAYEIKEPSSLFNWIDDDNYFGAQRLKGCNPLVLRVCTAIPENFGVSNDWLKPYLEGWTLTQIIGANRLFIADFRIMGGIECKKNRTMCAPLALFFFTEKHQLKPLAIQLNQEIKEGNPVFIPTDNRQIWLQAKMWFNMVDACHHLILGRLLPHLILEGIYAALRRNLAQSHPLYILLAPHFDHLLPVNKALKDAVFSADGWISRNIQLSKKGIRQLLRRGFKEWRFSTHAMLHRELETRGVLDQVGLSVYPYRDDSLLLYKVFNSYASKYVQLYYPEGRRQLLQDTELQNWRRECCAKVEEGGLGLEGVPGNYDAFTQNDDLVRFLVGLFQLLVVQSAATRSGAYDEYGFPPNYPINLSGMPPEDPLQSDASINDIVHMIPNKHHSLDTMLSIRLSSKLSMKPLGEYRTERIHDPRAKEIFAEFKQKLGEISRRIQERNRHREEHFKYYALDPACMANFPGV